MNKIDLDELHEATKRIERNMAKAEKNIRITVWMWKYLLIPMWLLILAMRLYRRFHS